MKQEAEVMSIAKRDAVPQYPIPVPKVLYTSTADDESEVGAEFVVREYVEVSIYVAVFWCCLQVHVTCMYVFVCVSLLVCV